MPSESDNPGGDGDNTRGGRLQREKRIEVLRSFNSQFPDGSGVVLLTPRILPTAERSDRLFFDCGEDTEAQSGVWGGTFVFFRHDRQVHTICDYEITFALDANGTILRLDEGHRKKKANAIVTEHTNFVPSEMPAEKVQALVDRLDDCLRQMENPSERAFALPADHELRRIVSVAIVSSAPRDTSPSRTRFR